ncbi:MAG TPA: hypothetical protein VGO58_05290 [Chitinophagaceae bacterium]|nr:hypothetical protein [Chitinophagaceae bacterium]
MRYLKTGIVLLSILYSLSACAQGKYGIKKINAFTTERMPGNIPVEMPGEPVHRGPDTLLIIYVETKGNTASWDTAWWNNKSYSINASLVSEETLETGIQKTTGKRITLRKESGNQLWVLYLEPQEKMATPPVRIKKTEILLQGKYGTKRVTQLIRSYTELEPIPSV